MYTIKKITSTRVTITFKGKTRKLETWGNVAELLLDLNTTDKTAIAGILTACAFLKAEDIAEFKKRFCPTIAQKKAGIARTQKFQNWVNAPNPELDIVQAKMVNNPGFMGNGYTREEVVGSIPAELLKLL